ncbi:MAG: GntR family transcriptional regulator [Actinomycetia bacterium]|nr:GntR family transcriptional regulator [Actinomycetes bacterium]
MTTDATADRPVELEVRRDGLRVQQTHEQLVDAILRGDFSPGDRLRDSLIADQFGLSRAPVREALRLLHQEGLVSKEPNRSYEVAAFTDVDLMELAAVRISLETTSIRALVHLSADLSPVDVCLDKLHDAAADGDRAAVVRTDLAFHTALVEATGLRRLIAAYRPTRNQTMIALLTAIDTARWPGRQATFEEHRALLEAIRTAQSSRDPKSAMNLLESHILGGRAVQIIGPAR